MFLSKKNRVDFQISEAVDILMKAARAKFPDDVPDDATVDFAVDIDDDGEELIKLTWK